MIKKFAMLKVILELLRIATAVWNSRVIHPVRFAIWARYMFQRGSVLKYYLGNDYETLTQV